MEKAEVPAHIGIGDQLNWRLGVALQSAPSGVQNAFRTVGFAEAFGVAKLREHMARTAKGRGVLEQAGYQGGDEDDDFDSDLTWSVAGAMLERRRANREIHCDSYAVYRSRLDSFKSARATIFHERAYSLPRE